MLAIHQSKNMQCILEKMDKQELDKQSAYKTWLNPVASPRFIDLRITKKTSIFLFQNQSSERFCLQKLWWITKKTFIQ